MNSQIKKEFNVSRGFYVPVYPSVASALEPTAGSVAYDASNGSLLISDGETWSGGSITSPATPTSLGTVYGSTPQTNLAALGNLVGTALGRNVFVGARAGRFCTTTETDYTFVGTNTANVAQNGTNKTSIGDGCFSDGQNTNSTGIGRNSLSFSFGGAGDNTAVGTRSQQTNQGSRNCSIGHNSMSTPANSTYNDTIAIGSSRINTLATSAGVINIGGGSTSWDSGSATDTIYIGSGDTIPAGTSNVIALGSGTFASSPVADNTFAVADDITQWRSLGLSVSASANVLQIDPATGIITQAASSKRFKENIRQPENIPVLSECKVYTYEVDGETSHGVIAEEVPEFYATSDSFGVNGVSMTRIIMELLRQVQALEKDIQEKKRE